MVPTATAHTAITNQHHEFNQLQAAQAPTDTKETSDQSNLMKGRSGSLYTLQWVAPPPLKLPLPIGGYGPPSNKWFLGPTRVLNQTVSQSLQPFLMGSQL